jgi:predicted GH43/DUF377 family glycosyl hydrolase
LRFIRLAPDPFLAVQAGTFYAEGATTADVLEFRQEMLLFFGGLSGMHERIGLAASDRQSFDGRTWTHWFPEPIVDTGAPNDFDALHVTDPASTVVDGKIYLYYSGIGRGTDSIGLAISSDGRVFEKLGSGSVMPGRAPEIVVHDGRFYLFFVRENGKGGYSICLNVSKDGLHFSEAESCVVLSPTVDSWDCHSVTTPRILKSGGRFMMVYAGDDRTKDEPKQFGLAFSEDLRSWSKYGGNPVFACGQKGSWDEEAIWFGTPYAHEGQIFMLYEGCRRRSSNSLAVSQIGLAKLTEHDPDERRGPS